jgi:hypothetical protein
MERTTAQRVSAILAGQGKTALCVQQGSTELTAVRYFGHKYLYCPILRFLSHTTYPIGKFRSDAVFRQELYVQLWYPAQLVQVITPTPTHAHSAQTHARRGMRHGNARPVLLARVGVVTAAEMGRAFVWCGTSCTYSSPHCSLLVTGCDAVLYCDGLGLTALHAMALCVHHGLLRAIFSVCLVACLQILSFTLTPTPLYSPRHCSHPHSTPSTSHTHTHTLV